MAESGEQAPAPAPRTGRAPAWLALLLALAALGSSAFLLLQLRTLDSGRGAAGALQAQLDALERAHERLQRQLAAQAEVQTTLAAELQSARGALAALEARSDGAAGTDNVDAALAEAEFLVVIAVQRLLLARDPETALAALEAADRRLAGLDAPGIVDLRARLAADMNALASVPAVDLTGMSLFLADLVQRVGDFTVRDEYLAARDRAPPAAAAPREGWRGLLQEVWSEISRHLVISRAGAGARVTLLPEQRWFLAHNLRLQLETARLAVLRRDSASLRASVTIAIDWLETYFDTRDAAVGNVVESLRQMQGVRLDPELPDISSALESVRALRHADAESGAGSDAP